MSLPDNVTSNTAYTVRCTNEAQGFSVITVATSDDYAGCLKLKQDGDTILIDSADVPGLLAALQAASGTPAPQDPAYVIDNDGDRWDRNDNGLYAPAQESISHMQPRPLDKVRAEYGIREAHA